jgi:hypothetical protein
MRSLRGHLFDPDSVQKAQPKGIQPAPSRVDPPTSAVHSDQLKMFMSSNEILQTWGPLDGDREENWEQYEDGTATLQARSGQVTGRSHMTNGRTNFPEKAWVDEYDSGGHFQRERLTRVPGQFRRAGRSMTGQREHNERVEQHYQESDDQLWDRKYREADMHPQDYAEERGEELPRRYMTSGGHVTSRSFSLVERPKDTESDDTEWTYKYHTPDWDYDNASLRDKIVAEGVKSPVRLGHQTRNINGQNEIVGGHHRLAVMRAEKPDELMPVLHYDDLWDAKISSHYPYT